MRNPDTLAAFFFFRFSPSQLRRLRFGHGFSLGFLGMTLEKSTIEFLRPSTPASRKLHGPLERLTS